MSTVSNLFTNISNQTDCTGLGITLQYCRGKRDISSRSSDAEVWRSGSCSQHPHEMLLADGWMSGLGWCLKPHPTLGIRRDSATEAHWAPALAVVLWGGR